MLAIDLKNQVTAAKAGLRSRTLRFHRRDDDSLRALEPETFGDLRRNCLHADSELLLFFRSRRDNLAISQLVDARLERDGFLIAHDGEVRVLPDSGAGDENRKVGGFVDALAVVLDDNVTYLDTRLRGRTTFDNRCNESAAALWEPEGLGNFGRDALDGDSEPASSHSSLLNELRQNVFHQIDGDGEADAEIAARPAENGGVDANHFAAQIDQRTSGISRIDRSICLNKIIVVASADVSSLGADNPGGESVRQTEWTSHRDHPVRAGNR